MYYDQSETVSTHHFSWQAGEPQHPPHGRILQSPWSTLCPFPRSSPDSPAHQPFSLGSSALAKPIARQLTTPDIVTREFGDSSHHLEHSRDNFLQNICFFADDFICDFVCQRQNAPQPIQKHRRHLVVFVLFLQELDDQGLPHL